MRQPPRCISLEHRTLRPRGFVRAPLTAVCVTVRGARGHERSDPSFVGRLAESNAYGTFTDDDIAGLRSEASVREVHTRNTHLRSSSLARAPLIPQG